MARETIKRVLAPYIEVEMPKRLRPIYGRLANMSGLRAGQESLAVPAATIVPKNMLVEISDSSGESFYTVQECFDVAGVKQVWLNRSLDRDYLDGGTTVTIAGGHPTVRESPNMIKLEHGFNPDGSRWSQDVTIDDFEAMFGSAFPTNLPPFAKPSLAALQTADRVMGDNGNGVLVQVGERGFGRFFDKWRQEGLLAD